MKTLKHIGIALLLLAVGFFVGWFIRPMYTPTEPISGTVPAETVAGGMTETPPDTVYVPVPVPAPGTTPKSNGSAISKTETVAADQPPPPAVVPIESVESGAVRDSVVMAALMDWNTKRTYTGTLFDDSRLGKATYGFDVQFNKAGAINYRFTPPVIPTAKAKRWGLGIQVGYGASIHNGKFVAMPYVGFGINYNLWTW